MRRRKFIALLGSAVTGWSLAARAQQGEPVRRIGVLMLCPENDPAGQLRATAFRQGLEKLGWAVGRNVQIDFQWGLGDADWIRSAAAQLLRLVPDVILANGDAAAKTVQQSTSTVPVIFIAGSDAVANGLVQSLAHPGGNLTGFSVLEPSLGAKLLELLKEIAPSDARVAILFNQDNPGNRGVSASAAAAALRFAVEVVEVPLRESNEIEAEIEARALLCPLGGKLSLPQRGHLFRAPGHASVLLHECLEALSAHLVCDGVLQSLRPLALCLAVLAGGSVD